MKYKIKHYGFEIDIDGYHEPLSSWEDAEEICEFNEVTITATERL